MSEHLQALGTVAVPEQPLALVLVVVLSAAAVVAVICRRLGVEAIPGYLLAGALVGPNVLGLVRSASAAEPVANLATVLLLFTIGLQFDAANFRRGALSIIVVSISSTILYILLFWLLLLVLGVAAPTAMALAMAGCSGSTAVTLRLLQQRREFHEAHGRVSMGFSILDDLSGVVVLATFPLLAAWASTGTVTADAESAAWSSRTMATLVAVGGVALMLGLGRLVLPWVMLRVARLGSPEVLLICAASIALLSSIWTGAIGFSPEMGAFLAGFMLAGTPLRYQLVGQLAPTRDLLMAVFFIAVGLVVDPAAVGNNFALVLGLALAVLVFKLLTIGGCAWAAGMTPRGSMLSGVYNINAGEFTFVLLASTVTLGIVTPEQSALAVSIAAITLVATPLLVSPAHALGARMSRWPLAPWARSAALRETPAPPVTPKPAATLCSDEEESSVVPATQQPRHVIIAGFGPGGRGLADRLEVMKVPYVIVDLNPTTIQRQARAGRQVVFGDIANPDVLEAAGLPQADAVIVTIPDDEAALRAVQAVRQAAPDVFIGVRTQFLSGMMRALELGATEVVVAEVAVALALDRDMMRAFSAHLARQRRGMPTSNDAPVSPVPPSPHSGFTPSSGS
jgi:CPA2 family monovalent cation:H+ antiporter-2